MISNFKIPIDYGTLIYSKSDESYLKVIAYTVNSDNDYLIWASDVNNPRTIRTVKFINGEFV